MKIRSSWFSALNAFAVCALFAGISNAQSNVERRADEVKIYQFRDLTDRRIEVVSRIWVDSWRSAFWVPTYPSQEEAIAALQTEAARLGADGLLNVTCLDQGASKGSTNSAPAILCYGNAIRIRPNQG